MRIKSAALIIVFCFIILNSIGQKIKKTEIDKFTGKKRVETEYVLVAMKFIAGVSIKFRSVDSTIFLTLGGNWAVGVVGTSDKATFLFDDKSTLDFYPTSVQSYDIGGQYSVSSYDHQYHILFSDLVTLASKNTVALRREFNSNYDDIDIKVKNAKKIRQLAQLVIDEIGK